jgi:hypothetical protein
LSLCLKLFEGFQERWKFRQAWWVHNENFQKELLYLIKVIFRLLGFILSEFYMKPNDLHDYEKFPKLIPQNKS